MGIIFRDDETVTISVDTATVTFVDLPGAKTARAPVTVSPRYWQVRKRGSRATVLAVDMAGALIRAAAIGFRDPDSIALIDP